MPAYLNPAIRYETIDYCFQTKGKKWTWEELSRACGKKLREATGKNIKNPSERTIKTDISIMRSDQLGHNAPIVYDKKEGGYYYSEANFSILPSPLNDEDWALLNKAASILKQYRGFEQLMGIEAIIQRIEVAWPESEKTAKAVIQFDHPLDNPGQRWLDPLLKAIQNEQVLNIKYHPFHLAQAHQRVLSPYLLKEYNKRWFLIGWQHLKKRIEVLPLDRIKSTSPSLRPFIKSKTFEAATYFDQIIGVTLRSDQRLEQIEILAIPEQAKYIKTKSLHPSQSIIKESTTGTVFGYELIPNFELESLLLSFGERIEVLKPKSLRESIGKRLKEGAGFYL